VRATLRREEGQEKVVARAVCKISDLSEDLFFVAVVLLARGELQPSPRTFSAIRRKRRWLQSVPADVNVWKGDNADLSDDFKG